MNKIILIGMLFIVGCASPETKQLTTFKFGDKVLVPGFYSSCEGVVIGNYQNIYLVNLDCPNYIEDFEVGYEAEDLVKKQ